MAGRMLSRRAARRLRGLAPLGPPAASALHAPLGTRNFAAAADAAASAATATATMPEQHKFLFDLNGYVVVKVCAASP